MSTVKEEKGTISIHTENIFPIIKKFLYSDHEIFLRELVSNAVDATMKLKRLSSLGEVTEELGDLTIDISINKEAKTLTIEDRGIGMTAEEIKKYINQIAFSGATEFVEKFKDAKDANEIIGKFGLGFYSSFMVAEKVEIETLSYQEGAAPAKWINDGSTEFEITSVDKKERGTKIILHINSESEEFLEEARINNILEKYCRFLPVPIRFGQKDERMEDGKDEEGNPKYKEVKVDNIINDTNPIWTVPPSELKDEDYKNFYRKLYPFSEEPLFWIHLNVDYPFNLTGVLYFPKIKNDIDVNRNKIQLYSRQVFITDEVKDIVPEFLMLLHGVIDSPDIPLNVSRSYLQSDSNVKKINNYITKKVAEKLSEIFKNERSEFEKKWNDISVFVKYGMLSEDKFYDRAKDFALLTNVDDKKFTFEEYKTAVEPEQTDKDKKIVFLYSTDAAKQNTYIETAKSKGYDVLKLDGVIDSHFINMLEQKLENVTLKRVDSDTVDKLIDKGTEKESKLSDEQKESLKSVVEKAIGNENYNVKVEPMDESEMPLVVTLPEFMRRMKDMAKTGGGMNFYGAMPDQFEVSVNANHAMAEKILNAGDENKQVGLAKQVFDLALLSQNMLEGESLTKFIQRSVDYLAK
ncbi:molecular chaperone HtpG [Mangrovivirga sp. M17]|uniref:Molecular chaperone HtpG n=1 Tax=Mangrovivirga halotolerans TaxID=2993936 RepID=A0ABT3RRU9_9BACT|nr:molecular chaperone HtpG [Mangrovivirga halotolerans]MCX2744514.1 molecular chaperone HtpG [Mangrovivirga halotolerans]